MDLTEQIREFIRKNMIIYDDDNAVQINNDDNIFTKGFVNSLFAMRLLSFIEEQFSIVVDNDDLDVKNFSTVNKIVEFIHSKKA